MQHHAPKMATRQATRLRLSSYHRPELPLRLSEYKQLFMAEDESDVKAVMLGYDVEHFGPATFFPPLGYKIGSPFIVACLKGNAGIVKYLLKHFSHIIDVNGLGYGRNPVNRLGAVTPLIAACLFRDYDFQIVKQLLHEGADVNGRGEDGSTALHRAYSLEVVEYLVEHGAHINVVNELGYTPLMMSAVGCTNVVKAGYLLKEGARLDQRSRDGYTIVHLACMAGKSFIDVLLLKCGVNVWADTPALPSMDIDYVPHPLYYVAIGHGAYPDEYIQKADCSLELRVNAMLFRAVVSSCRPAYDVYVKWVEALELLDDVAVTYPLPVEEYGGRVEVSTNEELDAIWGSSLEVAFQRVLILERCLGMRCVS